jgi:choline dehydrogenase-like flavoprotein
MIHPSRMLLGEFEETLDGHIGPMGNPLYNRIELDSSKTDSNGIPAARATYTLGENTRKMLEHGAARAKEVLEAAGAIEIIDWGTDNMAQLMGTARMRRDAQRSVVNASNQAHDVPNLFVVDGSSFTTAAAVNPTSTIGALALRAADGIWNRRREWTQG